MKKRKLIKYFISRISEVGWVYIDTTLLEDNYPELLVIKNRGQCFWVNFTNKKKWSYDQKVLHDQLKKHNHPGYIVKNQKQVDTLLDKILPISFKKIHEMFEHREDGHLYWLNSKQTARDGKQWGSLRSAGRDHFIRTGVINKIMYSEHQLVWFMYTGVWGDIIDHINHNPLDNRIENLRSVSRKENQQNLSKYRKRGITEELHDNIVKLRRK